MSAFTVSDRAHWFDSARDAIDAVSAFEANAVDDWEYRLEASFRDDALHYRVNLNNLSDTRQRGYLEPIA